MKMDLFGNDYGQINKIATPESKLTYKLCIPSHHEKKNISHPYFFGFHTGTNKVRRASVEYVKTRADNSWNSLNKLPTVDNWQIYPRTSPRFRRGGMTGLAFG